MADMEGLELLHRESLQMGLPFVMISVDDEVSAVVSRRLHGACGCLVKPVRMEDIRVIWHHVVRKNQHCNKVYSDNLLYSERNRRATYEANHEQSTNHGLDGRKSSRRRDPDEYDVSEEDNRDSCFKKQRLKWTPELENKFAVAVNIVGIDKAVPKKIVELMNVPGVTNTHVGSHLQKYRGKLRKAEEEAKKYGGLSNILKNIQAGLVNMFDFPVFPVLSFPPQSAASQNSELLNQLNVNIAVQGLDQTVHQQPPVQGPNLTVETGAAFGQSLLNCQTNISGQFPQASLAAQNMHLSTMATNNLGTGSSVNEFLNMNI